jgi:minor extracellular serine protease Vpr
VDVRVAGESSRILFSGLTPGFAGLYQVNLIVPPDAPSGNLDLQIVTPYSDSAVVTLPVQ